MRIGAVVFGCSLALLAQGTWADISRSDVSYVAHAGEEYYAPPHSRAAYAAAVEHGLDIIKLDLHFTKDGHIVCNHDATLMATMGWDVKISDVTLAEIRQHRFKPRGGHTNETIVTLSEALEYGLKAKRGVWLDPKGFTPKLVDEALAACDKAGLSRERIMIATWRVPALEYCRDKHPEIRRVLHTGVRPPDDAHKGWRLVYTKKGPPAMTEFAIEAELAQELLDQKKDLGLYGFNLPQPIVRHRKGKTVTIYDTPEGVIRTLKAGGTWISIWFVEDEVNGERYRAFGADNFVTSCAARTQKGWRATNRPKAEAKKPKAASFDIRTYGARPEATAGENAKAIQSAIDAAAVDGGKVVVPAGTWTTGTLWLKSGVELNLKKEAVLKASADLADYNAEDAYPENWGSKREGWRGRHLIIAREAVKVSITGPGTVDGSGDAFFADEAKVLDRPTWIKGYRQARDMEKGRPGQMVVFVKCRDVFVGKGVRMCNSPCWTLFCHGCDGVTVRDYVVRNGPTHANTDGLDIDCCRNVLIERADVVTGDDGLAIRASGKRLGAAVKQVCENIVVRSCSFESEAMGIRLGVGEGIIRNVTVEDVKVPHSSNAIAFYTWYGWTDEMEARQGIDMEEIVFRRVTTGDCLTDVYLFAGGKLQTYGFRKVTFADCTFGGLVGEDRKLTRDAKVEDIAYVNCRREPVANNSYERFLKTAK